MWPGHRLYGVVVASYEDVDDVYLIARTIKNFRELLKDVAGVEGVDERRYLTGGSMRRTSLLRERAVVVRC